ncbi:hypothetical protein [Rhodovulum steppense]|uniref:Uncharacterized protein n=1 Tax=Rhodovulum steppense TaxID=540251 RepID=A0A4R1YSI6_9RHOB|nr:hypothetical protein [Rhodovulum steppense]TCM82607.1 hypothetical protein EV216_11662 [Rhodovulum steppense]
MTRKPGLLAASCLAFIAGSAQAEICDYKPSKLVGNAATAVGASVAGGADAAGIALKAAGYYTLLHSGSGLTLLGSTAAGASAAGTVGIIAGTAGAIGSIGSVLMAPVTVALGAVAFVGAGAYEGFCYFRVDRVTDPYDVRRIIESIAANDDAVAIVRTADGDAMELRTDGAVDTFLLRNLYIADGQLKHRKWGPVPNRTLGPIVFAVPQEVE